MATYAIGDIQGCYDELQQLLEQIQFDPTKDKLWFAGDLVNRGPKSLDVLRFVKDLGDSAITVLGNHDLHLIAVWKQHHRHSSSNETLQAILDAPDCDELLNWLRSRPLLHRDHDLGFSMLHAGLPPQWTLAEAELYAKEVETVLQGESFTEFLQHMYGNKPKKWSAELNGWDRLRFIVNSFTRLRFCKKSGKLKFKYKGAPGSQKNSHIPWYRVEERRSRDEKIVFGHWSTLGLYMQNNVFGIDTGCLWGGSLTALQIDCNPPKVFQLKCQGQQKPSPTL
jgi:bis(5'-nucleosyl)-tetraphosphatase (symmetrical)